MFGFSVEKWRKWIESAQTFSVDPAPVDLILKWVEMESGGNVCSPGIVENGFYKEAGLAQTYFTTPTTIKFGVTSAQLRAKCDPRTNAQPTNLTDDDRKLHARVCVETFKEARDWARRRKSSAGVSWSESSFDFWALVKLGHALPAVGAALLPAAKAGAASSWAAFREYVLADQARLVRIAPALAGRSMDNIAHWLDTCEEFASTKFTPSRRWGLWALVGGALALLGLSKRKGGSVASG